jgi:DNA mismatch repair protein MutS2
MRPDGFKAGRAVLVGKNKTPGVLKRRGRNGMWVVEAGSVTLSVPETELTPVKASRPQTPAISIDLAPTAKPVFELNLLGMRLEDAVEALDKQIDAAVVGGLHKFSVVHGKGEGILRQGIHARLRERPEVGEFNFSHPDQGGTGRTEVELR